MQAAGYERIEVRTDRMADSVQGRTAAQYAEGVWKQVRRGAADESIGGGGARDTIGQLPQ